MHRKRTLSICLAFLPALALLWGGAQVAGQASSTPGRASKARLVWSDEFNGPNGSQLDSSKWTAVEDGSGFGNNELEYYTARPTNVRVQDGNLILTALKESYSGKQGEHAYTSGRIESRGKFSFKYGRIEARAKLPHGQGIWPAFWMLGSDFATAGWPNCGEVDIMENVGQEPDKIHGSLHGPGYSGATPLSGIYSLPNNARFSDDYHVFGIEWQPKEIRFYVDGRLFETQKASDLPAGKRWVFDHPFYVVLNVAVGGYWPGAPDATTRFPQSMLVDYVRVYKLKDRR
jgi:beta-glucanase (GH16 family)